MDTCDSPKKYYIIYNDCKSEKYIVKKDLYLKSNSNMVRVSRRVGQSFEDCTYVRVRTTYVVPHSAPCHWLSSNLGQQSQSSGEPPYLKN